MKLVIAYVKKERLTDVILSLHSLDGLSGVSMSEVKGFGRSRASSALDRMQEGPVDFIIRIRLEVFCPAELAGTIVSIIEQNARTGSTGAGKIYVIPLEQAVRISTGERGEQAV